MSSGEAVIVDAKDAKDAKDARTGSNTFPFLQLPPELRNRVYAYLFANPTGTKEWAIEPILFPGDRRSPELRRLGKGIAMLRVCKAIHAEAPSVLYGQNTFWFRDHSQMAIFKRPPPLKQCSLMLIYFFLQVIGAQNRKSIAHLELTVGNVRYFYHETESSEDYQSYINGGKFLGDAFDLLSKGHSLRSLELSLETRDEQVALFHLPHLLRPITQSRLLQQMMKLNGLVALNFSYLRLPSRKPIEIPSQLKPVQQALQKQLLSPRRESPKKADTELAAAQCVDKAALSKTMPPIFSKILQVSAHYTDLQVQITKAKEELAAWRVVQDKITATEKQVEGWVAEAKKIEQGLQQFEKLAKDA
ncbi:hypothetical protein MMC13_006538 [Lambiella insularis]|nr:hypothetical protein [Lambiella insularis]